VNHIIDLFAKIFNPVSRRYRISFLHRWV